MFPGSNSTVYRNEAGEPIGWSNESEDAPYNPDDYLPGDDEDEDYDEEDKEYDEETAEPLPEPRFAEDAHLDAMYEDRFEPLHGGYNPEW